MELFTRTKIIDANLGNLTIREVMNFPKKENAGFRESFINEIYNPNHIQIAVKGEIGPLSSKHDVQYDMKIKKIIIFSRPREVTLVHKAVLIVYGLFVILNINININKEDVFAFAIFGIFFFMVFKLNQIVGVKLDSKGMEREVMIRINYLRRNKRIL